MLSIHSSSLNLRLANENISARTDPILNDIFVLLEPLSMTGSDAIRPLAREARVVMTARLASTSGTSPTKKGDTEDVQETYQKALKLLNASELLIRIHLVRLHIKQIMMRQTGLEERSVRIH